MEEIVSMVLHGCKLAKELEANLPGMTGQPALISRSCDEIIKPFLAVREKIMSTAPGLGDHQQAGHHLGFNYPQMLYSHDAAAAIDQSLQEWLRSNVTQAMDLFNQTQNLAAAAAATGVRSQFEMVVGGGGREYVEGSSSRFRGTGGGDVHVQVPVMEVSSDSAAASRGGRGVGSSSTRQRRR